jgi:hypothetical protein
MKEKFTDQQMALILKRAAERQAQGGEAVHSLESIQDIARQVGIDPQLVADAAATLERGREPGSLLGPPSAYRSSRRLAPGALDQTSVLSTIRDYLPFAGEPRPVEGGFEWHAGPADNKTLIAVTSRADATTLRIDARQDGPKAMTYLLATTVGGLAGGVSVALLSSISLGLGAGVGVAALAASLASARAFWNRFARRRDKRLHDLSDALARQLEAPNEGSDPRG